MRGSALIRHYFGLDPATMEDEEWSQRVSEAIYVARFNATMITNELKKLLLESGILTEK